MKKEYKIIFIGTSQFAIPALEKLIECGYQIPLVITQPDKPAGRQRQAYPSPVKQAALKSGLEISQPERISAITEEIESIAPDLIVVAAYGQIIPKNIIELPLFKTINIHPSLLPKYRGASPIQTAILDGAQETGTTLMLIDEKTDHGPLIAQKEISIDKDNNYPALEQKLAELSASLLIETLPLYLSKKIKPIPQDESRASYTKTLTKQDGKIDWRKSALEIERKIRAFYPWPGTWTEFNGQRVKIIRAQAVESQSQNTIKTGNGFLALEIVQPEGKNPMTTTEFLRGRSNVLLPN